MLKKELIKRSPIRVLEKSIHGGLGNGNLGVFSSRKGVGKTACLDHVAIDALLRGLKVLHISFNDDPQHVESWYRQLFEEVSKTYQLENAFKTYDELVRHRLILNFNDAHVDFDHVHESITRITGAANFKFDVVVVDGYHFESKNTDEICLWKEFAINRDIEIWFSAIQHRDDLKLDERGVPAPVNKYYDIFSVIIMLKPAHDYIDMKLLKDHHSKDLEKLRLKLDPKTLLICNHRI